MQGSKNDRKPFRIVGAYDTETTNYGEGPDTVAFPVLFIVSDLSGYSSLRDYDGNEPVRFLRTVDEFVAYITALIESCTEYVPIICAYNLMFDMQPIIYELSKRYVITGVMQSSTHAYCVDLKEGKETVLRLWDTFHLEMRGLAAMGATCGMEKAMGDWDYSLVRTPETPLTDDELYYAKRDVQVIPAYLKWLLNTNEWLTDADLGYKVMTKTSLVRQQAANEIGPLKVGNVELKDLYLAMCADEFPRSYSIYALRKACFRGGFTFTAAAYASRVQRNVCSLDVTSMHHAFINGRLLPVRFRIKSPKTLQRMCETVLSTTFQQVLKSYHLPFTCAFHACVELDNVRLRDESAFKAYGIGLIPEARFRQTGTVAEWTDSESAILAEKSIRVKGYHDAAKSPVFAYGKLYSAEKVRIHINEIELYAMSLVYEWDGLRVMYGEGTTKFVVPPDYVTLQSNLLFERKQDMKTVLHNYIEGEPYVFDLPSSIPDGIANDLKKGDAVRVDLEGYYNSTVKGMFNGIYGVQAQDLLKPEYRCVDGKFEVDKESVANAENFVVKKPKTPKCIYHYGMRIVGGSRLHLVAAIKLIYETLGEPRARVLGGDTDSIKVALNGIVADDVLDALKPLHAAVTNAIAKTQQRVRGEFPRIASRLTDIGVFDDEGTHELHMEAWNKARVWLDNGKPNIVCAGLSRPKGQYTVLDWITDRLADGWGFEQIATTVLGYNVEYANEVCHMLERSRPDPWERVNLDISDYLGRVSHVDTYQSIALYDATRTVGDTLKRVNAENIYYQRKRYGYVIDETPKYIDKHGVQYG